MDRAGDRNNSLQTGMGAVRGVFGGLGESRVVGSEIGAEEREGEIEGRSLEERA